jgi:hypothetical protein
VPEQSLLNLGADMKRKRFIEEQIIGVLKESEAGENYRAKCSADFCLRH